MDRHTINKWRGRLGVAAGSRGAVPFERRRRGVARMILRFRHVRSRQQFAYEQQRNPNAASH